MQSIILAGGFGTRLQKIVSNVPKPLAPVNGKPFLHYVIAQLRQYHCTQYVFSLYHKAHQIEDFIKESYPQLPAAFVTEPQPLGTGGALKFALHHTTDSDVLVVNADTFADVDISAMHEFHLQKKADCTIAVKEMTNFCRYGAVSFQPDGRITAFEEKKSLQQGYINAGYLIINRNLFAGFDKEIFNFETGFLIHNITRLNLFAFPFKNTFIDIGVEEDYLLAQQLFINH